MSGSAGTRLAGESYFLVMHSCGTASMNAFLQGLSSEYSEDRADLVCDRAAWHKSKALKIPENIRVVLLPPATPEMNPVEHIWKEIRKRGFRNECFKTLDKVIDRLCDAICGLSKETIKSITGWKWILDCF